MASKCIDNVIGGQMTLHILVVDDDPIIRLLHQRVLNLSNLGHAISVFEGGAEAIEFLLEKEETGKKFLILLDINMPGMNGWQFLEDCQEKKINNLYVVMVTSSLKRQDKIRASSFSQVIGFFEKPFTKEKVIELTTIEKLKPFLEPTYP